MIDQRAMIQLELKKNDYTYTFSIPQGSQLVDAYGVLFDMMLLVKKSIDDLVEKEASERSKKELGKEEEKEENNKENSTEVSS